MRDDLSFVPCECYETSLVLVGDVWIARLKLFTSFPCATKIRARRDTSSKQPHVVFIKFSFKLKLAEIE